MPKMKTKSAAKKRFRVSGGGNVKVKPAKMRHMQMNKPKSMKRKANGQTLLCESNERMVLDDWMPYAGVQVRKARPGPAARKEADAAKHAGRVAFTKKLTAARQAEAAPAPAAQPAKATKIKTKKESA